MFPAQIVPEATILTGVEEDVATATSQDAAPCHAAEDSVEMYLAAVQNDWKTVTRLLDDGVLAYSTNLREADGIQTPTVACLALQVGLWDVVERIWRQSILISDSAIAQDSSPNSTKEPIFLIAARCSQWNVVSLWTNEVFLSTTKQTLSQKLQSARYATN